MSRCIQLALVLSIACLPGVAACEYADPALAPALEPPTPVEVPAMSTTDVAHAEPAPPPRPAVAARRAPILPDPEPVHRPARFMTRAGPKWKSVKERPRVVREPVHATEAAKPEAK